MSTDRGLLLLADALSWIEIALLIFFVVFVLIVARVVLARRGRYDGPARLPLDEEHIVTPRCDSSSRLDS